MAALRNTGFTTAPPFASPRGIGRSQLRRTLLGSVASLVASTAPFPVLAQGGYGAEPPMPSEGGPTQLPAISVEGTENSTQSGYKVDQSSLGKLTEPLVNTPFTIETVTRQLMDDQGVITLARRPAQCAGDQPRRGRGSIARR
jgi:outer membrane receptor for monomeric catechols